MIDRDRLPAISQHPSGLFSRTRDEQPISLLPKTREVIGEKVLLHTENGNTYELLHHVSIDVVKDILRRHPGLQLSKITRPNEKASDLFRIVFGEGRFSKARLAKRLYENGHYEYVAVRSIKSQSSKHPTLNTSRIAVLQSTQREILLQQDMAAKMDTRCCAIAEETLSTLNKNGDPQIYQFLPLADLGNGEQFLITLSQAVASKPQKVAAMQYIANTMIKTIAALNKQFIFIRDIKLENILVFSDQRVMISDFGSMIIFDSDGRANEASCLTHGRYMPPFRLFNLTHPRAYAELHDQWSLGLALLQLWNHQVTDTFCQHFYSLATKYQQYVAKSGNQSEWADILSQYKKLYADLKYHAEFQSMPSYLQQFILSLLNVENSSRDQLFDDLIGTFAEALSSPPGGGVNTCFERVLSYVAMQNQTRLLLPPPSEPIAIDIKEKDTDYISYETASPYVGLLHSAGSSDFGNSSVSFNSVRNSVTSSVDSELGELFHVMGLMEGI